MTTEQAVAAIRHEREQRRAERMARLAVLLPQSCMVLQNVEQLRNSVRAAIGTDSRVLCMNVQLDFAVEMLDRFVAACEAEQMAGTEPAVLSDQDRAEAQEAARR